MDSIALEATLDFVTIKNTSKFANIINKYKPSGVSAENIKYYFTIYENLETMCATTPFGNEVIYYPQNNQTPSTENLSGKVFVLTFVCNYNFSNDLTKKFFSKSGENFLISGRGVGICH
jgi:hypothetical protein